MSDELLDIFWVEVSEHLETLNGAMLKLELLESKDSDTFSSLVQEMNRVSHSMKGAARAVGISVIETLSHYLEEIFGATQQGKIEITPDLADTIYDSLDLIQMVADNTSPNEEALNITLARMEQIATIIQNPHDGNQQMHVVTQNGDSEITASAADKDQDHASEIQKAVEEDQDTSTSTQLHPAKKTSEISALDTFNTAGAPGRGNRPCDCR